MDDLLTFDEYKKLNEAIIKSSMQFQTFGGVIDSPSMLDIWKYNVDRYLNDLYRYYLQLKKQYPRVNEDDFVLASAYLLLAGKITENQKTKKIDVQTLGFRFSDHHSSHNIDFNFLKATITKHWHLINENNVISSRNKINFSNINIINKHPHRKHFDYNVDKITNKSSNFKLKSKGIDISKFLTQNENNWEIDTNVIDSIKILTQSYNLLESNLITITKQAVFCLAIIYD